MAGTFAGILRSGDLETSAAEDRAATISARGISETDIFAGEVLEIAATFFRVTLTRVFAAAFRGFFFAIFRGAGAGFLAAAFFGIGGVDLEIVFWLEFFRVAAVFFATRDDFFLATIFFDGVIATGFFLRIFFLAFIIFPSQNKWRPVNPRLRREFQPCNGNLKSPGENDFNYSPRRFGGARSGFFLDR
jgi:hypothetical protein